VIGVITLVCEQSCRLEQPQQHLSLRDIVNLAAGQDEPQRISKGIDDHVDFRLSPISQAHINGNTSVDVPDVRTLRVFVLG